MKNSALSNFDQLFRGYWSSEEKWRARLMLVLLVALNLFMVYLLVKINEWYKTFYDALQAYESASFWPLVGEFTLLAFIYIIIAVYAIYLRQMVTLKWRTWMTEKYLGSWLNNQTYYRLQMLRSDTDNPDQRISEDISQFTNITLTLLMGLIKEFTTLAAFGVVLWNLSGAITVPIGSTEFVFYGYMFWFSLFYSTAGTWLAHIVGRKLIKLNFEQQRYEADFRFSMMRMRENSESIAFYKGELAENIGFKERFSFVIKNFWELMRQTKILNFYVNGYAQLAIIVPLILVAPRYFDGAIALGGLMQTVSAFGRVQDALSFFVTSYDTLANLASVIQRLTQFTQHMNEVDNTVSGIRRIESTASDIVISDLKVALPDGRELFTLPDLKIESGTRVLVTGVSGAGKSTLLRTLAGIWPYTSGEITSGEDNALFLPQRPYLPLGSMRRAICYPRTTYESEEYVYEALRLVGLEHFIAKLDTIDDWSRILSLGEQQRLAFARVLLVKPSVVYLDEATSALDEPREAAMYELLARELPQMTVVSVGHRSTLYSQHSEEVHIEDGSVTIKNI